MPSLWNSLRTVCVLALGVTVVQAAEPAEPAKKLVWKIERLDPRLDKLLAKDAKLEELASGFDWSEGPVWDSKNNRLLFSDVPQNVVFQWPAKGGAVTEFLRPSGYTGSVPRGGEPGSNGLTFDAQGRLTLCQHGDRRVARVEADGKQTVIADKYQGKRFNSPNDVVYKSNGDVYFTDPPYGLLKRNDDPAKELDFCGVYRVNAAGEITLLTKELGYPNGLAFSPDEKTLYVAQSDPDKAIWMAYPVKEDGTLDKGRLFADVTAAKQAGKKGLPDGLKVDVQGNLWATGPGGVLIFAPDGTHLGTIDTGEATANVAFGGPDNSTLYVTADRFLCRIPTLTKGATK